MAGWSISSDYYKQLATVESGNDPFAKALTSSASGLYQFTKGTWTGLGFDWNDRFNVGKQNEAVGKLTQSNAAILAKNDISLNSSNLYAAHVLGAGTAVNVLQSNNGTPLGSVISSGAMNANPQFKGMTVGDFKAWLGKKMGGTNPFAGSDLGSLAKNNPGGMPNIFGDGGGIDLSKPIFDWGNSTFNGGGSGDMGDAADLALMVTNPAAYAAKKAMEGLGKKAGDVTGINKLIEWLKGFFSVNTAARFTAVFVALLLIGAAVWAILQNPDKVLQNVTP